jgi:hypothetical protein
MSGIPKLGPRMIIRAFRAVDDPAACSLFAQGHGCVLKSIGVEKISSSELEWAENPAVFVVVLESADGKRVYGGARIHIADGMKALPIEKALGDLDQALGDSIALCRSDGIGEICALWNSRDSARYGVGSNYLARSLVAISTYLGLNRLVVLTAPYVVDMVQDLGFIIDRSVGRGGTFTYPKPDMTATVLVNGDLENLVNALEQEKAAVLELREKPDRVCVEVFRGKRIELQYKLSIENYCLGEGSSFRV